MQLGLCVDSFFHGEVGSGAILGQGRREVESWTLATGLFPSFTTEWVGAVTGEGPHVMQGKYQWCLSGESWQLTEVKIVAKKITRIRAAIIHSDCLKPQVCRRNPPKKNPAPFMAFLDPVKMGLSKRKIFYALTVPF